MTCHQSPKVIIKSDQEPALKSLIEEVIKEGEQDMTEEESPVGESKSNGEIERAIQQLRITSTSSLGAYILEFHVSNDCGLGLSLTPLLPLDYTEAWSECLWTKCKDELSVCVLTVKSACNDSHACTLAAKLIPTLRNALS